MEFGKVTEEQLVDISFKLPNDHQATTGILARTQKKNEMKVFVGCAKWGRKDWLGTIYPTGTKEADFLSHYARHFNSIELNATFYKLPTRTQTASWRKKVGEGFLFCPKISQKISHIKRLKDAEELTLKFIDGISGFGENLGPVLLMPHPGMGAKTIDIIEMFLDRFPKDIKLFVELRHRDWFKNSEVQEKIFSVFERTHTGAVITDAAGRADCLHMRLTQPEAFIRFVGNGLHPSDYSRVDDWVDRIKTWRDQGIENVYFFMHQADERHSPQLGRYVIQRLNQVCGLDLPEPQFVT